MIAVSYVAIIYGELPKVMLLRSTAPMLPLTSGSLQSKATILIRKSSSVEPEMVFMERIWGWEVSKNGARQVALFSPQPRSLNIVFLKPRVLQFPHL